MSNGNTQSAGAIVLASVNGELRVAMSHEPDKGLDRWILPKGHVADGESYVEAARREVAEEVGLTDFIILTKLGVIERPSVEDSGETVLKDIHMFLGWCPSPSSLVPQDPKSTEAAWKPVRIAASLIPFDEDRKAFLQWLSPALERE